MKKLILASLGLLICLSVASFISCKQTKDDFPPPQAQIQEEDDQVLITLDGEHLKKGKGVTFKVKKGTSWKDVKTTKAVTEVTFEKNYGLKSWKLDDGNGQDLVDIYEFHKNKTIFATSERNDFAIITIDGENLKTGKGVSFKVQQGTSWKEVKTNEAVTNVSFYEGYELDVWKLDDKNGSALSDIYEFYSNKTIFATSKREKITITIDGEDLKTAQGLTLKVPEGSLWKLVKERKEIKNIEFADNFVLYKWTLTSKYGADLTDDFVFNKNQTIFARKQIEPSSLFKTDGNGSIIGYLCDKNALPELLIIPDVIKGKKITSIGSKAFENCETIKELDLAQCKELINIGERSFYKCSIEGKLILPDSLKKIENYAFSDNKIEGELILPSEIIKIGEDAFSHNKKLEKVDFSKAKNLTSLAGFNSTGLASIDLSECTELQEIGKGAFLASRNIEIFDLSQNKKLTTIGGGAFSILDRCIVTLPDSITEIGKNAFGHTFYTRPNPMKPSIFHDSRCKQVRIPNGVEGDRVYYLVVGAPCSYSADHISRY